MHVTFSKAIQEMASVGWGREEESTTALAKKLTVNSASDAAGLEILRGLIAFANSFCPREEVGPQKIGNHAEDSPVFPDVELGQVLYFCDDLECGVYTVAVVGKTPDGHLLVCDIDISAENVASYCISWASEFVHRSVAEALKHVADYDLRYHRSRFQMSKRIIEAINEGKPLDEFKNGVDMDSDEPDRPDTES